MLSGILYGKRFFPYYVNCIVGGLDENGRGAVYSYDPVGSYERESFRAGGSASSLLQPLLDNQVHFPPVILDCEHRTLHSSRFTLRIYH